MGKLQGTTHSTKVVEIHTEPKFTFHVVLVYAFGDIWFSLEFTDIVYVQPYCSVLKDLKTCRDVISVNVTDQRQESLSSVQRRQHTVLLWSNQSWCF